MTEPAAGGRPDAFDEILEGISEGVLLLDETLKPVLANSAAQKLLGLEAEVIPLRLPSDELLSLASSALHGEAQEQVLKLWFPTARTVKVRAFPLLRGGVVLAMQDVTEEFLAQRIRREFVTHASHELKSPVAGMQALASAIRQAVADDPDTAARFSDKLVVEADRLGRLIGDLLDLSRLEEPGEVPSGTVDLADLGRRVVHELEPDARSKSIQLQTSIDVAEVKGDAQQLSLLLRNLLDNAIRYSPGDRRVRLEVFRDGDEAVVRVSDEGIGIPLEAQARIFERFYRVDKARSRDRGGTGLGLAIVKHVAELHGGRIEVESELGRGSVFTFRLPTRVATDPAARPDAR